MPTYCYRYVDNDELVELRLPSDEAEDIITCLETGRQMRKDFGATVRGFGIMRTGAKPNRSWPMQSTSLGIAPDQVGRDGRYKDKDARRQYPNHKFNPKTGDAVISSQREYRRVAKDVGFTSN